MTATIAHDSIRCLGLPRTALATALCFVVAHTAVAQNPAPADGGAAWSAVQQALGGRGTMQPGDVLRFGFPRSDLQVTVDGVVVKPALALGTWTAFKRTSASEAVVMGDLVLTEDEVGPVMLALQQGGVEQTALHHHVMKESPRVLYMHIMGHGDPAKLAQTIRTALGQSRTPIPQGPAPASAAAAIDLDTAAVAKALGFAGKVNGGVYQVAAPRVERITDHGVELGPPMGTATSINFQPTGGGKAAITGDFVMIAPEVNRVIRALREHGIQVTALHSHMLDETPRLLFMHFWANDDAVTLTRGLRAALDVTNVKHPGTK